ncbi:LytR/AlgR family response regulator transcription factor [Pareuzebyella sediminis]|uniref:LytR/AlgR family response regulator transcription factor n=1 Tax=Pareuzebyella sediminis TaxID=2607998 RepID=UPI0011EFCAB2|nr:LytTR family DNA-binding domain-containing protein [Pareuzebyella sediminis]
MIRCIIIEDQPPAQRVLKKYIGDMQNLDLRATFADALQAIDFLKTETIDLIFLDIHLPKISGIDFLKTVQNKPNVILTTAFSEYALESYEYNVVDYLLKPFSFERFVQAVSKIPSPKINRLSQENTPTILSSPEFIFIKSGHQHVKVAVAHIEYIQSDADYTELFESGKKHLSQEPLRFWEEYLDSKKFIRIHRSYIVNTSKIDKVVGNQVYLGNQTILPIGRAYKEAFMEHILGPQ